MKTKLFSLFVALIATMSVFAYDFKYGDLYYNIEYGTAEVTYQKESPDNYSGLTSVVIPKSVTDKGITYRVTSIGYSAFSGCSGLTSVTIPNSVTTIEGSTFSKCYGLTSITIPNSVTRIGWYAFSDCSGLTSITIPNSVTSIGLSAFEGCSGLTSVTIPNSVTSIGDEAFSGCRGLTSVTIGNNVTSIGSSAFEGCSGLTSVQWNARNCANFTNDDTPFYHSDSGRYPYSDGFDLRSQITSFTFGDSVQHIPAYICDRMDSLTSITIPNSVTSIGDDAFSNCSGLTSVTIPDSVTSIGDYAFYGCSGLTSISIGLSVTTIENCVFSGCTGVTSIVWNAKSCKGFGAYYEAPFNSKIASFTFGDEVEYIPSYLCYDMSSLTSITIPNSVTSIGDCAFKGCSNLETVTFGSGLQNIGANAFKGCQNIYEMTVYATQVPNVVSEESYGTFQGVSKLAELHVPAESVKKYKIHPVWGLFNVITAIPYTVTLLCDNVQGAVVGGGSYQPNEQVTITAKANAGYRFVQWSDGITTNPRTIVVTSDTTLTAEFEEIPASEYTVSVVVDPTQHGTVQMTLTAVPDEGYQFARWSDGNTENPRTILVTENMTLSATFNLSTKASNASAEESQDGTRKVFRNGQMYIIRGEKTYTATGSQL